MLKRIVFICAIIFATVASIYADTDYVAKRGDTFANIAKKFGITETELKNANPNKKNCYVGLRLSIPKPGHTVATIQKKIIPLRDGYYVLDDFDRLSQEIVTEAANGNVVALKELGDCYRWGSHLVDEFQIDADPKKAMQLYMRADSLEYPYATMAIAEMYNAGTSVKRDVKKAAEWYDRAFINLQKYAEMKDAQAMAGLAEFYVSSSIPGNESRIDPELGAYWYKMAVKNGNHEAAQTLGMFYRLGFGVDKDETEALKWDSRFCVEADKKGWVIDGYPAHRHLIESGHKDKAEWVSFAKDTYNEAVNPRRKVESAVPTEVLSGNTASTQAKQSSNNPQSGSSNRASQSRNSNNNTGHQHNHNKTNNQQHSHNYVSSTSASDIPHVISDGYLSCSFLNCYECGGTGLVPCAECNGTGYVPCTMGTFVFDRPYANPFIAVPRKIHSPNCGTCNGTGRIKHWPCNMDGKIPCRMCAGKGQIVDYHIKEHQTKVIRPQYGSFPSGSRLGYVSVSNGFQGMRTTSYVNFLPNGRVKIGMIEYDMTDNGDTWILRSDSKSISQLEQFYLAKNFTYLIQGNNLLVIWPPEDMAKQELINQQALAQLNAISGGYSSPSNVGTSQIGESIKQEIAVIEARQNARSKQELRDAKLNVALTQSNRLVWCDKCKSMGLKHTHY